MDITKKVAKAYLNKKADEATTAEVETPLVPTARLVDLGVLIVAYQSYVEHVENIGSRPGPLTSKGLGTIKRYSDELTAAFQQTFGPLADRQDAAAIRTPLKKALSVTSATPVGIGYWAAAFQAVMPWLKIHSTIFNNLFTGKVARAAKEFAVVAQEENPTARLNKLAAIAPVSGMTASRRWVESIAAEVGAPLSTTESTLTDAQAAKDIGQDLNRVEASLSAIPPNTPEAADLQGQKVALLSQLDNMAKTSANPAVVLAAAASAKPTNNFATQMGAKLGMTPDQEDAMMVRGRAIIAAGAGSGKTRVLAGKVAYSINELGIPASAILATSFTRKASAELVKRCVDYGAVLSKENTEGFGTTHSIAGNLLRTRGGSFKHPNYIGAKEGWKQTTLFRLAVEQVKMGPFGIQAPPPKSFFDVLGEDRPTDLAPVPVAPQQQPTPNTGVEDPDEVARFRGVLREVAGYLRWAVGVWPGQKGRWAGDALDYISDALNYGATPGKMTPDQKAGINAILSNPWLVKKGQPLTTYRVAATATHGFDLFAADEAHVPGKTAGFDLFAADELPKAKTNKMDQYVYFKNPARQWFNIGADLMEEDAQGNKKPIPISMFKQVAGILKGKGVSPSEVWHNGLPELGIEPHADAVAVYGAYEWLKGSAGEPDFQNTGDMDDLLVDAVRALRGSATIRRQVQAQYKVLLVDEAQDLNRVQHLMFGLMAGYLDPKTMKPYPDGRMTADTFAMIGDDKQAIYEFRGADPEEFISKSNLVESGGGFQTKLLDTNFRSGAAIVQAANNLIAHNKRQVPMVCKANVDKNGQGRIASRLVADTTEAAASVAEEIADMKESDATGNFKYKNFGVAVRSNAEAYSYGLEMLKLGIPFKSKAQFFNDPNTKALIGWLTIAHVGLDGNPETIEDAIRDCTRAPLSMLGKTFFTKMEELATGSWARWLVDGGWKRIYAPSSKFGPYLQNFVNNLVEVTSMDGTPAEITRKLLLLKGVDGQTTEQTLIDLVMENDELMSELAASASDGKVTAEAISEEAMAPIRPLLSLVEGRDDLGSAVTFIHKLKNVNSKLASGDTEEEIDRDAVTIGTMHGWKGLEVDTMYIPMVGGKFPRATKEGVAPEGPALASERRLAYVAITRAEQRAIILNIPDQKYGFSSQFLDEACVQPESAGQSEALIQKTKLARKWTPERLAGLHR